MKYLIYTTNAHGHNMEYIHHISEYFANNRRNDELIIAAPKIIKDRADLVSWTESKNISWYYFDDSGLRTGAFMKDAYNSSKLLGNICKQRTPDEVILLHFMAQMPFLLFFLPKGIRVSGIVYNIYLYRWERDKLLKKIQDTAKYYIFSKASIIKKVYILNDRGAVRILNKIWKTNKFVFLADPFVPIDAHKIENLSIQLDISKEKTVFLHMGSITRRKGVLYIFDIISKLSSDELSKSCFIFAGKIWEDVKSDFYMQYERWKNSVQIFVFDEFCSYEFFGKLCKSADYIVLPYMNTCSSSGTIAYGAQFHTPVIVPEGGMVPKLVKRYRMGIVIKGDFVNSFVSCYTSLLNKMVSSSNLYMKTHSVDNFLSDMFEEE